MDKAVKEKFDLYPQDAYVKLMKIRDLIFQVADDEKLGKITETLKWGEPSYLSKKGSTIRIDWKSKHPDQVSIYFNCNTVLIETFKELYSDTLNFKGNREIVFYISEQLPMTKLKSCLSMSLRYHLIKNLDLLGA